MFSQSLEIGRDAFNHPEIRSLADMAGGRLRFQKELMNRLMVQCRNGRVRCSACRSACRRLVGGDVIREEVCFRIRIEIDTERLADPRLATAQAIDVILAITVVKDSKLSPR